MKDQLEGIVWMEVQADEKPKGEILVGPGGETLRPPGMNAVSFFNMFSAISFSLGISGQPPL